MKNIQAKSLMTADVLTVRDDMDVATMTELLVENEISGAPVMDRDGKLVGVVSLYDAAAAASDEGGLGPETSDPNFYLRGWEDSFGEDEVRGLHIENRGRRVRDIMSPPVYTVPEEASAPEVARKMLEAHLHRLLVTRDGKLAGIITTFDLLRLLAEE